MDTKEIATKWSHSCAILRKPNLKEACDVINELCMEINKVKKELEYQKNRQDSKEQHFKTMFYELHNVLNKYI